MRTDLLNRCNLFIENRDAIKFGMRWSNSYLYPICSSILTQHFEKIDIENMKRCNRLIKKRTGVFSYFRAIPQMIIATLLSLDKDPDQLLQRALYTYDLLKEQFHRSEYLPVCAMMLTNFIPNNSEMIAVIKKAKEIYDGIKSLHPMITRTEDATMIALLALSDLSVNQIIQEVERCYQILRPSFSSANAVQAISLVLALSLEPTKAKCERVVSLYRSLKAEKCKYGKGVELATLGVLVLQNINEKQAVQDICEINEYLLRSKGFGTFGVGRGQRIMYASMLMIMATENQDCNAMNAAVATAVTTSITVAQQVALSAAIAASAASSASA